MLTAGFPCQPFSVAGSRKGADDDRYLWPQVVRAIHETRPAWVVGENVAGILTMVQPGEEVEVGSGASLFGETDRKRVLLRQEYVIETVCRDLEREGYEVRPFVIPACAVGVPHRRDRVWIVARRTGPDPTSHGDSGRPGQIRKEKWRPEAGLYAESLADLLPTPTSIDSGSGRINKSPSPGAKEHPTIALAAKMGVLPTPTASCHNAGTTANRKDGTSRKSQLNHLIARQVGQTSQLNPLFVQEMMGFPYLWTELPFQSGDRKP